MSVKKISIVLAAAVLVGGFSGLAQADLLYDTLKVNNGAFGNNGGGEYILNEIRGDLIDIYGVSSITSFCLERSEEVEFNRRYHYEIAESTSTGDPLDDRTAYLYLEFWNGTLPDYPPSNTSANNLQDAIWFLEGEKSSISTGGMDYVKLANDAVAGGFSGLHGVKVLRLTTFSDAGYVRYQNQDVLCRIVPVPGAIWLGMGLIGCVGLVGGVRRRFRAK